MSLRIHLCRHIKGLILLGMLVLSVPQTQAQIWPPEGVPLAPSAFFQAGSRSVSDGQGGAIAVWLEYAADRKIKAQRIDGQGQRLWGPDGIIIAEGAGDRFINDIASDGAGGLLVCWYDSAEGGNANLVQRFDAQGNALWALPGVRPNTGNALQLDFRIVADGMGGGAIVAWQDRRADEGDIYAQRLNGFAGTRLWGLTGSIVDDSAGTQENVDILPDGSGGAVFVWQDTTNGVILAVDKDAAGNSDIIYAPITGESPPQGHPRILDAPDGGFYLLFTVEGGADGQTNLYLAKIGSGWIPVRIEGTAAYVYSPSFLEDPATGDVLVLWRDNREDLDPFTQNFDVYLQRITSVGIPLYPENGLLLCDRDDLQSNPFLTVDGEGNALVAWTDARTGSLSAKIFAQKITRAGQFLWPQDGRQVTDHFGDDILQGMVAQPDGGALLVYLEQSAVRNQRAQRLEPAHGYTGYPEPVIDSLADVPGDQGGHLLVGWSASPRDLLPDQEVSHYSVWRAASEAAAKRGLPVVEAAQINQGFEGEVLRLSASGDFYWEYVGQQLALQFSHYGFDVPTYADSTSVDDALQYVQVVAHLDEPGVTFASAVDSASSTDDLAPGQTQALVAQRNPDGSVELTWNGVGADDLRDYAVFRAMGSGVVPEPDFLITATPDTTLTDFDAPVGEQLAYVVAAVDIHENQGAASNVAVVGFEMEAGLVAYYPFNGNADDASGNGNHGTPNADTQLTSDRLGLAASAYAFNGQSSRITVPASPSLESADTAVTMAAWIKLDGWSLVGDTFGPVLMKSDQATNGFMYRMYVSPSNLGVSIGNWNQSGIAAAQLGFGDWYHVATTWDGSESSLYLNGQLIGIDPLVAAPPLQDGRPLIIGADQPGLLEVFNGVIDEVRIYNRALSGGEIAALVGTISQAEQAPQSRLAITSAVPNPFNPSTALHFSLDQAGPVKLQVFDVQGRLVRTLVNETAGPGEHRAVWQGRDDRGRSVASGVYLARLLAEGKVATHKLLLAK